MDEGSGVSYYDFVIHMAGPFQGKVDRPNGVPAASVMNGIPYGDGCDDYCMAFVIKAKFAVRAVEVGVPCVISTRCWVSNKGIFF